MAKNPGKLPRWWRRFKRSLTIQDVVMGRKTVTMELGKRVIKKVDKA